MNKLISIPILLLLASCTNSAPLAKPKYVFGQSVDYPTPTFFRLVCSGRATVEAYRVDYNNQIFYTLEPPYADRANGCVLDRVFLEEEVSPVEPKKK